MSLHKPVLLDEVLRFARETEPRKILDGTFGRGGHTRALLDACPQAKVVAIDQDDAAIAYGQEQFATELANGRLVLVKFNFHSLASFAERDFDVMLLDLGVSSPQLDEPARGFSFYHDGPLDMRMNQTDELTAADIVNTWPEVELLNLFMKYGEIRRPQRVVRAIVNDRASKPYSTTRELSSLMERIEGWQRKGHHPATRYFLALRMAVNNELAGLETCVPDLLQSLSQRGRLLIITFHSLEDRIIKYAFREGKEWGYPLVKKVITPSREEERENPRARSAKLRVFQRGSLDRESSSFA